MRKPRSSRFAPRNRERASPPARVLLFPCLVQLPYRQAPPPPGPGEATGDRERLVFENGGPGDAVRSRAGRAR